MTVLILIGFTLILTLMQIKKKNPAAITALTAVLAAFVTMLIMELFTIIYQTFVSTDTIKSLLDDDEFPEILEMQGRIVENFSTSRIILTFFELIIGLPIAIFAVIVIFKNIFSLSKKRRTLCIISQVVMLICYGISVLWIIRYSEEIGLMIIMLGGPSLAAIALVLVAPVLLLLAFFISGALVFYLIELLEIPLVLLAVGSSMYLLSVISALATIFQIKKLSNRSVSNYIKYIILSFIPFLNLLIFKNPAEESNEIVTG